MKNAVTTFDAERFADALGSELTITTTNDETDFIRSRYDALPLHMKHPQDRFNHWMRLAQQDERRATDNFLASALGFEPTDSSTIDGVELFHDMAPFTVQPKPQVCTDFGFEPTEGCE